MRATRAIDALHGVVPLKFYGGWRGRGQGEMSVIRGTVWHDTVTPYPPQGRWTVEGMLKLLAFGREGLRGLLSQFGMEPDGTWWVIGDGKAYHNGYGTWGNNALGLEVMAGSTIVSPPQIWTPAQFESAAKGTAAIARAGVHPVDAVQGHKEQDRGRKIDPYGVDMNRGRDRVRYYMVGGKPAPLPEEEDDMLRAYTVQIPADGKYHAVPFPPPGRPDVGNVWITFAAVGKEGESTGPSNLRVALYNADGTHRGVTDNVLVGRGRRGIPALSDMKDGRLGSCSALNRGPHEVTALVELVKP